MTADFLDQAVLSLQSPNQDNPDTRMDFFEQQERAHRRTRWLAVDFVLVVFAVIVVVYFVVAPFVLAFGPPQLSGNSGAAEVGARLFSDPIGFLRWAWRPHLFVIVAGVCAVVIGGGSLLKMAELAKGGSAVAVSLGGRPLSATTKDVDEQKLLHVVEEMAIASGLPIPEIYVLENESGINAFAAGHTHSDTAIGVTQGGLKLLTREELQGVIGHEFSHILNGDTRLNMRLIGLMSGILCIALIGRGLLRVVGEALQSGSRSLRKSMGVVLVLGALGVLLLAVGSIGVFLARLIKSGIARQRELLADAAAVQFTRNPAGLAGALKKIGGLTRGSRLRVASAEEASHLFFGNGLADPWVRWLATHPPLEDRIRALDPTFDGTFPNIALPEPERAEVEAKPGSAPPRKGPGWLRPDQFIAAVGLPTVEHLDQAVALRAALPEPVRQAASRPAGAIALIYALLLDTDEAKRTAQLKLLSDGADPSVQSELQALLAPVAGLGVEARLPLIDLAIPALRRLSADQYSRFTRDVQALIESDQQLSLFEYTLQKMFRRHLQSYYDQPRKSIIQFYALKPLVPDCVVLLSALARVGQNEPAAVEAAFRQGADQLKVSAVPLSLLDWNECNLERIDPALDRLAQAAPMIRRNVLYACAHTVAADGQVQEREAELLRAIADALDCPVPQFFPKCPA
jgi:Zn-dependent protease with chaperone function